VGHFAGFWKFSSRPSLCDTPPERQAPDTLCATADSASREIEKTIKRKLKVENEKNVISNWYFVKL